MTITAQGWQANPPAASTAADVKELKSLYDEHPAAEIETLYSWPAISYKLWLVGDG